MTHYTVKKAQCLAVHSLAQFWETMYFGYTVPYREGTHQYVSRSKTEETTPSMNLVIIEPVSLHFLLFL